MRARQNDHIGSATAMVDEGGHDLATDRFIGNITAAHLRLCQLRKVG